MKHHLQVIEEAYNILGNYSDQEPICYKLRKVLHEMQQAERHLLPDWKTLNKPIMCIDFDGVISQYKKGWNGAANLEGETPVDGAFHFIEQAVKHFTVLIFSSRCNSKAGILAIEKWVIQYGLSETVVDKLIFQPGKPSYHVVIDDRAFKFSGKFPSIDHFVNFEPWYYKFKEWRR